jgi:heme/copper-type cytochrome/quinol oxidase subunit 3
VEEPQAESDSRTRAEVVRAAWTAAQRASKTQIEGHPVNWGIFWFAVFIAAEALFFLKLFSHSMG